MDPYPSQPLFGWGEALVRTCTWERGQERLHDYARVDVRGLKGESKTKDDLEKVEAHVR